MYIQVVFSQTHDVICYYMFLCQQGFYMLQSLSGDTWDCMCRCRHTCKCFIYYI